VSSITVVVDVTQADALLDAFGDATADVTEGLVEAVESALMPDLELLSSAIWNVRTGQYMSSWEITDASAGLVTVTNTAEALSDGFPYSLSLEYGWKGVPGGYVAEQAVDESGPTIAEALLDWVMSQLPS